MLPPEPKPPRVKSLLVQMHEEWVKLAQRDGRLTDSIRVRHEARFTLSKAEAAIRLRLKFLQRKAVERIQHRNGVRVIPGYRMPGGASKEDTKKMVDQLRQLAGAHGFELPEGFSLDQPQLPAPIDVTPAPEEPPHD